MSELRPTERTPETRSHAIRVIVLWAVSTIVLWAITLLLVNFPPGDLTLQAEDQSKTMKFLLLLAIPVFTGVVVFLMYCFLVFRQPSDAQELLSGPAFYGNIRVQIGWVVISAVLVVAMAIYGTLTLVNTEAAKAVGVSGRAINNGNSTEGETGEPAPNGKLDVQVIGQQWYFTYRYPGYGAVETNHLVLPENTRISFHVTSLDVIHSFWAYELGVKADAVPGNDNVAYATTENHTGTIHVRCAELCGLWHGEMADASAQVVSVNDFLAWIKQEQGFYAEVQKSLPHYAPVYYPDPLTKGH